MDARAARQCAHPFYGSLAALAHDIRCAERFRQFDPIGVAAQNNNLFSAKAPGRNDATQADSAVTDHGYFFPVADPCHSGRMMARPHHVRERE